jgi:predicted Fe-Mo cluster-binding NifX family protein
LKTAFSTNGYSIQDLIEPAFGRCKNFLVVDSGSRAVQVVPNPGAASAGGAGVQAAETLIRLGIDKLVAGSGGPTARPILKAADRTPAPMASNQKATGTQAVRNPAGYCFCQHCGHQTDDDSGLPCFKLKCPACGSGMERRFN